MREVVLRSPVPYKEVRRWLALAEKEHMLMGMIRIMSRRGDQQAAWDQKKVLAHESEAVAAVLEAERIFELERVKGATAFRVTRGQPAKRIEQFDATAEQIVLVPRVIGG